MECLVCQNDKMDVPVFETDYWEILVSVDQAYIGRCYIKLKRHSGSLSELTKEEWGDFIAIVKKLESALKKAFNTTMFNWSCSMNDTYKNNLPNPHVHWHLRPRYNKTVKFEGLLFEDKEFAHHYDRARKFIVSKEILVKVAQKIKENL